MDCYNILLVPGEPRWTSRALHLACALARNNKGLVTLVKMTPAGHPALLGSAEGHRNITREEMRVIAELAMTAEKYDVPVQSTICQYASYARALVDAAEQLNATAIFATLPSSHIPYWTRFQQWRLQNSLARHGCTLYTVEPGGGPLEWTPSVTQTVTVPAPPQSKESNA